MANCLLCFGTGNVEDRASTVDCPICNGTGKAPEVRPDIRPIPDGHDSAFMAWLDDTTPRGDGLPVWLLPAAGFALGLLLGWLL